MCLVENQWNVAAFAATCPSRSTINTVSPGSSCWSSVASRQGGAHDACSHQDGIRLDSLHNSFTKGRMVPTMLLPP